MYLSPEEGYQAWKQNAPKVEYCEAETKATRVSSGKAPENTQDKMSLLIVLRTS